MKYASKRQLIDDMEAEHRAFLELAGSIPEKLFDEKGVWGDGWTVKDLFAHLTAWEGLFLGWFRDGLAGRSPQLPAAGYTWRRLPELNREIWRRHRDEPWPAVRSAFDASWEEIHALSRGLSEEEIFEPGRFAWTKRNALVTYLGANTASHYRTARKILRRWVRSRTV